MCKYVCIFIHINKYIYIYTSSICLHLCNSTSLLRQASVWPSPQPLRWWTAPKRRPRTRGPFCFATCLAAWKWTEMNRNRRKKHETWWISRGISQENSVLMMLNGERYHEHGSFELRPVWMFLLSIKNGGCIYIYMIRLWTWGFHQLFNYKNCKFNIQ